MSITKQEAQCLTNDYINFGNNDHFDFGGNPIRGFIFTRQEVYQLIQDQNNHIFMMLCLSEENNDKHLNLLLGSIQNGTNLLNLDTLIKSSIPPYVGELGYTESFDFIGDKGEVITRDEFDAMQSVFRELGNNTHLCSASGTKIKAYHLNHSDINYLMLRNQIDITTMADLFIFMPVVRPTFNAPYDRPYLSMAVSRIIDGKLYGTIIEYCLPCPSACPDNYPIQ